MKAEYVNPFVIAASEILVKEIKADIQKGNLYLRDKTFSQKGITIDIGMTGRLQGHVLYSMDMETARQIASQMIGDPVEEFDDMAMSAIGELGNMISGLAAILLEKASVNCNITPPTILKGNDTTIHTAVPAIDIPFKTQFGDIDISVALEETR